MNGLFWGLRSGMASRQAANAGADAVKAKSAAERAAWDVRELEDRIDKLTLACMAMWSLLQECTDLTEKDLIKKVEEIDLRDGVKDGKVTKTVARCPKCERVMSPKHKRCLYCGHRELSQTAFDGV